MLPTRSAGRLAGGLFALTLLLSPTVLAQTVEDDFYRAYYLHHEEGRLEQAFDVYQRVAKNNRADDTWRVQARDAMREISEDLATADFSRLMPEDTIFYAELNDPGDQLRELCDQLGLIGGIGEGRSFGISPKLFDADLDLRGAALAVTGIDPNGGPPEGVLVLHPGNHLALRGLIETALPAGGAPADPIGGFPTWNVEGEAFVTLTSRLVIASQSRDQIEGVTRRLKGKAKRSLADASSLQDAAEMRGRDLIFFHLNAQPVLPMMRMLMEEQARRDPEAAMAMAFIDIDSLKGLSGRIGIDEEGLGLSLALDLEQGHQNLAFNLMRTPAVGQATLELVPEGAAFFLATSLNEAAPVAKPSGNPGQPIVTAMDFGREVFANIVDIVVYGLPPEGSAKGGMPLPDIVACIRVNDGQRSRALWNFILGVASQSSGAASMEPKAMEIAGIEAEQYSLNGVPVFLVTGDHEMLISPSRSAIARTIQARRKGRSIAQDPLFARCLEELGGDNTTDLVISPARCARIAERFMPPQEAQQVMPIAGLLADTVICVGLEQTDTRLALTAQVANLPDISPLVEQAILQQRGGGDSPRRARKAKRESVAAVAVTPLNAVDSSDLLAKFDKLAGKSKRQDEARKLAVAVAKSYGDDAVALNDFAWALLTEERYDGAFPEIALKVARHSNELTEYDNWALLDTLALAEFVNGDVERAIEFEKKAYELAKGSGREGEVEATLKTFVKALAQSKETVGAR